MKQFVNELGPNQAVQSSFLVLSKDVRQKKTGDPFLSLTLGDKSGDIDAKMWDNVTDVLDLFDRNDYVRVKGQTVLFNNKLQLTIHRLEKMDDREVNAGDYYPCSKRDLDEMLAELQGVIGSFTNPYLKALLQAFMADPDIATKYKTAPAAKSIHHAWIGGLVEHVLSLCKLAEFTAAHYAEVDRDLLLTGVVLHDIGKIHELTYLRGFGYSDEGQLVGHILIALRMLDEKIRQVPNFPPKLRLLVEHMIASHHGELAFGSPKQPLFLEAMLLHHLDNLDSKMETIRVTIQRDQLQDSNWTSYASSLERTILKKEKFMAEEAEPKPAGDAAKKPEPPKHPAKTPAKSSEFGARLFDALKE